ncbi:hypothetical protein [Rhizobium sp. G21]|uniref:hypothetical protein n=1 Tax=Rhizobium sp. G21 TaxID=2758439 RepID=UPI001600B82E|nr:hypothetical protein [Rhizobium sp. G21]MBB1248307.1 hypothetical protein [Rhizobium sp. G21]
MQLKYIISTFAIATAILLAETHAWGAPWDPTTPYGGCKFSKEKLDFAGDIATQMKCLLRKVRSKPKAQMNSRYLIGWWHMLANQSTSRTSNSKSIF